jgi:HD-GYP domain-containing protein (c-di-GMP phosphodiesterase class II)
VNTFMPVEQFSALSMRKISSREESLNAVLQAVSKLLGMSTSFLSNISLQEDLLTVTGAYVSEGGIPLELGMQISLSKTFCDMLVRAPVLGPLVLNDIRHHPGAQAHSSTQVFPIINSYIGVPVTLTDGTFYGTLCAVDTQAQALSPQHASFLLILARIVATQIECERELVEHRRAEASFSQVYEEQLCEANETLATPEATDVITDLPNHRATLALKDSASSYEESLRLEAVEGLAELLGEHDQYTGEHTQDVCLLVSQLAEAIKLEKDEIAALKFAARLHDIGKIAIPDAILNKPGKLDSEEWAIIQRHAAVGADIVGCIPSLHEIAPIIRGHHERWDGMGYPDKLAGEQIPFGARIIAVADSYSAMTTNRSYSRASSIEWAQNELRRCAGLQFDPQIVEDFIRLLTGSHHCDAVR